jgi:hypothetical protein
MKKHSLLALFSILSITSCLHTKKTDKSQITGSWKLFYNEIKQGDSIQIKDLSTNDFIKIINKTHFSFINQPKDSVGQFYAGGGTYTFDGENYSERLNYIAHKAIRGHIFNFKIEIKGDTLTQYGKEKVEAVNMDRDIIEKYLRIKN